MIELSIGTWRVSIRRITPELSDVARMYQISPPGFGIRSSVCLATLAHTKIYSKHWPPTGGCVACQKAPRP